MSRFKLMAVVGSVALLAWATVSGTAFALVGSAGDGDAPSLAAEDPASPAGPAPHRQEAEEGTDSFLTKLAENLGISDEELRAAVAETEIAVITEAAESGRIPRELAEEIIARVEGGDLLPLVPPLHRPHPHLRPGCRIIRAGADPVAELLGVTPQELAEELRGPSLAEVAEAHGVSADELVEVLVAAAGERIREAVDQGRITRERADALLSELTERVTAGVSGEIRPCGPHPWSPAPAQGDAPSPAEE